MKVYVIIRHFYYIEESEVYKIFKDLGEAKKCWDEVNKTTRDTFEVVEKEMIE